MEVKDEVSGINYEAWLLSTVFGFIFTCFLYVLGGFCSEFNVVKAYESCGGVKNKLEEVMGVLIFFFFSFF